MTNWLKRLRNVRSARLKGLVTAGVVLGVFGAGPVSAVSVRVVNDDDQGHPAEPSPCDVAPEYATIQEAIDAAAEGDLITICPGNYPEDLSIDCLLYGGIMRRCITGCGLGLIALILIIDYQHGDR